MEIPKQKTIYILCGDATYNRGDRGNLCAQIELLKEHFPKAGIIVDSYQPERDRQWYDATVVKRGLFLSWAQIKNIRRSDLVVWGGGALLADNASRIKIPYWFFVILFIRLGLRKPVMAWAHGIITDTKLGQIFARWTFNMTDLITVRDLNSLKALESTGTTTPHYKTADPAVLIRPGHAEQAKKILSSESIPFGEKPLFAIAATFCSFHYNPKDWIPYMVAEPLGLRKRKKTRSLPRLSRVLPLWQTNWWKNTTATSFFYPPTLRPGKKTRNIFSKFPARQNMPNKYIVLKMIFTAPQIT